MASAEDMELVTSDKHLYSSAGILGVKAGLIGWSIKISQPQTFTMFGSSRSEAMQSLNVIKHYGMNIQCFVGRPNPPMEFYLVDGESPEGAMDG
jgi:hypothetical protein